MFGRKSVQLSVAFLVFAGLLCVLVQWLWRPKQEPLSKLPPGPDKVQEESPYRNTQPGVAYVGDQRCRSCHRAIFERFRRHPMGQSLGPLAEVPVLERYDDGAHLPFSAQGFQYEVIRKGDKMVHRESRLDSHGRVLASREAEIQYVLGSGARGRSYVVKLDGQLFQSPISWHSQPKRWDLSPGYYLNNAHFERPVNTGCLFCHSNRVEPIPNTVNQFAKPFFRGHAIGCERCHGPGEIHVREQEMGGEEGDRDPSIVNPRKLPPVLRDAVCEQCHLNGVSRIARQGHKIFDYRPGLPLHEFLAVFVKPPELTLQYRAVSQVEQLVVSACFLKSNGKMGCISCHDPHGLPEAEEKAAFYRERCFTCHAKEGQDCKLSPAVRRKKNQDDCVACHMPRFESADVAHTAVTDHRILRWPEEPQPKTTPIPPLFSGRVPLVHFHERHLRAGDSVKRELGIALTLVGVTEKQPMAFQQALPLLEESLKNSPDDDLPVLTAEGLVLVHQGRAPQALKTFERVLSLAPKHEEALAWAGALTELLGQLDRAEDYWRRTLKVNPHFSNYHVSLARVLFRRERWEEAAREARTALQLNPAHLDGRRLLLVCYLRLGNREKARAEWEAYQGFQPPDLEEVRKLIEEKR